MTWQLAAYALLALALFAGFGAYERGRPPARLVALVATLAALGALGRVAFAALPNVKPLTDVALLAGFALGAGPGFAVGALAALASNFFFGQGPWTPWEMAAWGAAGVGGALLARASGGRLGRLPLAAACGAAGLAFGAFMDFGDWVNYSDHTGAWYLARAGTSLPFNLAHAIGNVLFCLAFGPPLLAALRRFRSRLEVTWRPAVRSATAGLALVIVAAALLTGAPSARAASSTGFLVGAQNSDGGFGGTRGQGSSQLYSGWAALGLAAAGRNPLDVRRGGRSVVDYIRGGLGGLTDTGALERTILVVRSAGLNPYRFGGRDLVGALRGRQRGNGSISGQVVYTSFGTLALRAAGLGTGSGPVRRAAGWLAGQQNGDGGFNVFGRGGPSGVDDTSAAVEALAAAGRRGSGSVSRAVAFLRRQQNGDGGFPLDQGGPSNAQSTAYAAQAFAAAGRTPGGVRRSGRSPLAYLRSLTAPDGSVRYSRTSGQTPVWVTAQALAALAGRPFPLAPVRRRAAARAAGAAAGAGPGGKHAGKGGAAASAAGVPGPVLVRWERAAVMAGLATGWLLEPIS